jgi:hypothetical protein
MAFKVIQTVAALEQLTPEAGDTVLVQGYLKPDDGGGGIFLWNGGSTEAPDRGTVISPLPMPLAGRWKRMWNGPLNVRWFGAQGDWNEASESGTDDYEALQAAAAALSAKGGGTLLFPPGTYRINRYKITGGPHQNDVKDVVYRNCTGLHILGYGAKIDIKGDFHRSADYQAGEDWYSYSLTVQPFVFLGCNDFRVEGLELYGNVDKMTRDPKVVEGPGSGIITANTCRQYTFADIYVHHFETDGISLGTDEPIADRGAVLINVRSLYNARNALSIINLRGATFLRCEFSQSGRAAGTYGSHAPGAGLDIEPEVKADVPTGDFAFIECAFVNGTGSALDASGGESLFKRCLFWGTDYYSMIANAPKLVFEDCEIYGECLNWFASAVPDQWTKYSRCHFEDKEYPETNKVFRQVSCVATSGGNVQLDDCVVIANKTKGVYLDAAATKHILRTSTIIHKYDGLPDGDFQSLLVDCIFDRVHFAEDMKNPPVKGWFLDVSPPEISDQIVVDGPYVAWEDQTSGAKLNGNALGNTHPFPRVSLELNHNMDPLGPYQGYTTLGALGGAPTTGTWKAGDVVLNQAPVAGGKVGWVCVSAGTPGTWRAFGQIDP